MNEGFQLTDIYVLLVDCDFMSFPEFHLKCIVEDWFFLSGSSRLKLSAPIGKLFTTMNLSRAISSQQTRPSFWDQELLIP